MSSKAYLPPGNFGFVEDTGRFSPNSAAARRKEEDRKHVIGMGLVWRDGEPWTYAQLDDVLECFLDGGYRKTGEGMRCVEIAGRSHDGVGTALRKMGIRYPTFKDYIPSCRKCRQPLPFGLPEWDLMCRATGPAGIKYGADCEWLAKVLQRSVDSIGNEFRRLIRIKRTEPILLDRVHKYMTKTLKDRPL
jgi:hypothetical protein